MQATAKLRVLDFRHVVVAHDADSPDVADAIDQILPHDGMTEIITSQRPLFFEQRLSASGCTFESRISGDLHVMRVAWRRLPAFDDLTGLEPPLPLERVLEACTALAPGHVYTAWLPRRPMMLFSHLQARGLSWEVHEHPNQHATLWVEKP